MREAISLLLGIVCCLTSIPLAASDNDERLVIIGKQLEFEALPSSCEGYPRNIEEAKLEGEKGGLEEICISFDSGFLLNYTILKILEGEYDSNSIEFKAYDHYGVPAFSNYDIAMIYLIKTDGQWYHQKYTWNRVYETMDGRYAECSLNWVEWGDDYPDILKPVSFIKPVFFDISHLTERLRERYANDSRYIVKGNQVTCQKGFYAEDILKDARGAK